MIGVTLKGSVFACPDAFARRRLRLTWYHE